MNCAEPQYAGKIDYANPLRKPVEGFRSGSKARGRKSTGVWSWLTQIWGKVAQRLGLHEFVDQFRASFAQRVSPVCAAGRTRTSVLGQSEEEKQVSQASRVPKGGRNEDLWQGVISHSAQRLSEKH